MEAIRFVTESTYRGSPEAVIEKIFNPSEWKTFSGWAIIPAVREVTISEFCDEKIGTIFSVENADGSTHREIVVNHTPGKLLEMRMDRFSRPLAWISDYFLETWRFERLGEATQMQRIFELHARNALGKILLIPIAFCLKRAIHSHNQAILQRIIDDHTI